MNSVGSRPSTSSGEQPSISAIRAFTKVVRMSGPRTQIPSVAVFTMRL